MPRRDLTQASKVGDTELYLFLSVMDALLNRTQTGDEIRNLDSAASHYPARTPNGSRHRGDQSGTSLAGRTDGTFEFAYDVVRRADELGFDTTLIAERFLGPDL